MALKQAPAVAYLSVLLLLSVTTFPSHVEATARLMPAAITGSGILRTSRVAQGSVRQLRQVYVTPEQVTESMSQFRAVDASLLKRVSEGQQDARVEYLNIMKGVGGQQLSESSWEQQQQLQQCTVHCRLLLHRSTAANLQCPFCSFFLHVGHTVTDCCTAVVACDPPAVHTVA